jgi:hypothetical protein
MGLATALLCHCPIKAQRAIKGFITWIAWEDVCISDIRCTLLMSVFEVVFINPCSNHNPCLDLLNPVMIHSTLASCLYTCPGTAEHHPRSPAPPPQQSYHGLLNPDLDTCTVCMCNTDDPSPRVLLVHMLVQLNTVPAAQLHHHRTHHELRSLHHHHTSHQPRLEQAAFDGDGREEEEDAGQGRRRLTSVKSRDSVLIQARVGRGNVCICM